MDRVIGPEWKAYWPVKSLAKDVLEPFKVRFNKYPTHLKVPLDFPGDIDLEGVQVERDAQVCHVLARIE